ncbi:MAG TPA: hypothetical protein VGK58_19335 [Lacipirellulaceae bacterium]
MPGVKSRRADWSFTDQGQQSDRKNRRYRKNGENTKSGMAGVFDDGRDWRQSLEPDGE